MPSIQAQLINRYLRLTVKPKALHRIDPPELRRWFDSRALPFLQKGVDIEAIEGARINGEWARPRGGAPVRTLLYVHGGGYVFGSPKMYRTLTTALAAATQCNVFTPRYRLAPEHPCPAAIEDIVAVYDWLEAQGCGPVAIAGDSAGGGLALSALMALRDKGAALPHAAVLYSPWTDLGATGASAVANDLSDTMFREETVREGASRYRGALDAKDPRVSPLFGDFAGLPPILIFASKSEILYDDAVRVVERARHAGVDVTFEARDGLSHVWALFHALMPEGKEAVASTAEFVRKHASSGRAR